MNKKIIVVVLVTGLFFWQFFGRDEPTMGRSSSSESAPRKQSVASVPDHGTTSLAGKKIGKEEEEHDAAEDAAADARKDQEIREIYAEHNRLYTTAIVFYGMVLDLAEQPVAQAQVKYMNADPTGKWTWKEKEAGADGTFVISGVRGRYLDVQVSHSDYYVLPESNRSFTYAGNDRGPDFKPDPAKPEVFRLKKKGQAAELIRNNERIFFERDEKERSFSLIDHSRRRDRPEYVILRGVETTERDYQGNPIRRLEMVIPNGGIRQRTDDFAFDAPTNGYETSMYFMRPELGGTLDYFVKFSSGNYGRFTISGSAGQYNIESYLNPDKSPNLEYDPAKEITVLPTGKMGVDLLYPALDGTGQKK